ncbi:PREDICTED: uncharacterized protein LOC104611304 [Nelumbo nucifera]|uniref:Uncharacterized protein LOC104611304 n=2 Tax=Nelumbo nucifera TaxID=4432 RepID=A0A1U8BA55_NELNU|nr:PREDICTED: uncharacterized protein LOC104611304 [Nelumbo nucifera]XP_010276593.1 PREDICTED: uncharacterized protein LOC104611304 [Nelumbo nucifera]XP_010276594.1 PREDICTED: uncharacterized protein LOC104611304 [Nelumbo nucifera]XP_010276595.1 PREDICTED: uncharacterized protein LOC104611304 [Nelumbo nucifera]XP_010276596.1 PREDICTED: uncharacterized protein LOC104611304 [Nelumbo nucifera]XP_010276597.1 PREDICTED: uncharacterized protein LOC104611304 [Nelumbo nucifera]XP_010276598.1 PREDICTE
MALRRFFGFSDGELMRSDAKPCSRLMRHTAGVFTVGGALAFWVLCRLHYGPRITVPRSLRWAACGAVSMSSTSALLVRLFSPECEPQNIAAYDKGK